MIVLAAGCGGGSGGNGSSPAALCQGICGNEAKLACPNASEADCNTGCQGALAQAKTQYPNCVGQINAVYACYGKVPTTSIHCSATSTSPDYDPGVCMAQTDALASCAGGGACPTIANVADTITQVAGTGTAPTPAGGTIVDGTYVLVMQELYPPVSANVPLHKKETLEIAAPNIRMATMSEDNPDGILLAGIFTTSGTQLTGTWQCGIGAGVSFDLGCTATATQLVVIEPPGTVSTYSKR